MDTRKGTNWTCALTAMIVGSVFAAESLVGVFPENVHCVGLVAPASLLAQSTVRLGTNLLTQAGYTLKISEGVWAASQESAQVRAAYLQAMYADPEVDLILCVRGGSGAADMLAHFDYDVLRANDKPLVGFSNISCLLNGFAKEGLTNLVSGPLLSTLVNYNTSETVQRLHDVLAKADLPDSALVVRRAPAASVTGKPLGGHFPSINGIPTARLPDTAGRIVFLEVNSSYTLDTAKTAFDALVGKGWMTNAAAVVLCNLGLDGTAAEKEELATYITDGLACPVFSGFPYGHVGRCYALDFNREVTITKTGTLSWASPGGAAAAGDEPDETIVIDPGDGVATNVLTRYDGSVRLAVNPRASGGGIVTLNPMSTHRFAATLGSGTLVATGLAPLGEASALGSDGIFGFGAGTLRYEGPAGATFGLSVTNAFVGDTAGACVLDAAHDLVLAGCWGLKNGAFVKDGAGTVTVADGANTFGAGALSDAKKLNRAANGDAPTQGLRGLTIADGTFRVTGGVNALGGGGGILVGAWRDEAKPACLEIAGGVNTASSAIEVGDHHGDQTSVLRVTGGSLTSSSSVYIGRNSAFSGTVRARLEMTGGTLSLSGSGQSLFLGNKDTAYVAVDIAGGTFTVGKNIGVSYGDTSTAAKHVDVVIRDRGVVNMTSQNTAQRFYFQSQHAGTVCNLTVKDGGTLSLPCLCRESSAAVKPTILFDGANVTWTLAISNPFTCSGKQPVADRVFIGTKGVTLQGLDASTVYNYELSLVASNTTAGAAAGVTVAQGMHCFKTAMTYAGPTTLNGGSLYLDPAGSLPSGTDLLIRSGTFKNGATGMVVRNLELSSYLNLYPGNPLHVTGTFAGSGTLNLYSAYGSGNPFQTASGTYPVITAPAAHAAALQVFAQQIRYGNAEEVRVTPAVTVSGDTATLAITFAPYTATPSLDAAGGVTFDVVDGLFRFNAINVNADVAADAARGKFQSFTLQDGTVQCTGFYGAGTGSTVVTLNGGLLEIFDEYLNPGSVNSGVGATVYLNAGATVRASGVQGISTTKGGTVYFNGGVVQPVARAVGGGTYAQNAKFYVSAGGAVFDMQYFRRDYKGTYINLKSPFLHDPALGATKDGGITVCGGPTVDFGSGFKGSTFTGPITVRDDGVAAMYGRYVGVHDYVVRPTGRLCLYDNSATYANDLTLGEAGATAAATLTTGTGKASNGPGFFVVSNDLQVLSPVTVWTGLYNQELPMLNTGAFTVLVYRASCTVDISLFRATDLCPNRTATVTETTIAGGAYEGWKALVLNVANAASVPADAVWTAVSAGGAWADAVNWGGAEPPTGLAKTAFFNAATAAAVPVALGGGVTTTKIYLNGADAAKGYAFTGPLALQRTGSYEAQIMASNGTHRVGTLMLPDDATLSVRSGARLEVDQVVGAESLTVNNAGEKTLHLDGFAGSLVVAGSGRTEVDSLAFATGYNNLQITGTGTLAYRGGDAVDVRTRIAGTAVFEIPSNVTVGVVARTNGTVKSTFYKTGGGTFAFTGTGGMVFDKSSSTSSYSYADDFSAEGEAPSTGYWGFNVAEGTLAIGTVDEASDAPTVVAKGAAVGIKGSPAGGVARLVLNNGAFTSTDAFYLGYYAKNTSVLQAQLVVNGGTLSVSSLNCGYVNGSSNKHRVAATIEVNGGELNVTSGSLLLGRDQRYNETAADKALKHVFRQNGGVTRVSSNFIAANSLRGVTAHGWVEVNGGVLDVAGEYQFGGYKGDKSDLWLNGGELRLGNGFRENRNASDATAGGPVTAALHFNGGVLAPHGDATGVVQADNPTVRFLVESGGAVVDTSYMTDGAAEYVWEPNLCATNAVDGGLVKRGVGTLVLAGSNTYHGATVVEGGELKTAGDHALDGTRYLRVRAGGAFDLGGGVCAVPRVYTDGLCRNGTLRVTDALVCDGTDLDGATYLSVAGNLAFAPGCALDLGLAAADEGPSCRDAFPLAVVDGTIEAPGTLKARNAGVKISTFKLSVVGDVLWATPSAGGTLLLFR